MSTLLNCNPHGQQKSANRINSDGVQCVAIPNGDQDRNDETKGCSYQFVYATTSRPIWIYT